MAELSIAAWVAWAGLLAGMAFGATVQRTHFCTMGAIADLVLFGDWRRMRAWLLAIAVAILASQGLALAGLVDLGQSFYRTAPLTWLGLILGGLLFGFGMTLCGGCASRNLVRLGAGSLKSLIVLLVMGLVAYATINGLLAVLLRQPVEALAPLPALDQGLGALLAAATGAPVAWLQGLLAAALGLALLAFCLADRAFRASRKDLAAGVVIGLLIPAGWWITGVLGADPFEPAPLASLTFVAPTGRSLIWLLTYPSTPLTFGIATVGGVILGAFASALLAGELRLESFANRGDLLRHLAGAALMGAGGVLALGCTIGQGVTGVSTLAAGSFLALGAIIAGGIAGVRYLEEGSLAGAARALVPGWRQQPSGL
jgi:hypothetical protein